MAEDEEAAVAVAREALAAFEPRFQAAHLAGLRRKLGLSAEREGDAELARDLLQVMAENGADFTLAFRRLCRRRGRAGGRRRRAGAVRRARRVRRLGAALALRLADEAGRAGGAPGGDAGRESGLHPAQPPGRGGARGGCRERQDLGPFEALLGVVSRPYEERPELDRYAEPPRPEERVFQTFCGT